MDNDIVATYCDSCHLGRAGGIFYSPGEVLSQTKGMKFIKTSGIREESTCCESRCQGKMARRIYAAMSGRRQLEIFKGTGLEMIIKCSPWCEQNPEDSIYWGSFPDRKVKDLVDLFVATSVVGE
ncbi:MAG: heterodisulfide reductase-related iron-sulfur binding cluster [Methanomassiliicoccales archaeon]|nr:heterodisulfide reductase-related iron-sulfur binding cluster [Methanomassiliicoccales archaeon]